MRSEPYERLASWVARQPDPPIGLRGTRRRRLDEMRRDGVRRADGGWFVVSAAGPGELAATCTLATYFALTLRGCAELAAAPAGGFRAWFAARPDLLPALIAFGGAPDAGAAMDRYVCLAPRRCGPSAPYTKVARAGAAIPPGRVVGEPAVAELDEIEDAEREALAACAAAPSIAADPARPLARDAAEPAPVTSRLTVFCAALADRLAARLAAAP
jgi:hypothetical protein